MARQMLCRQRRVMLPVKWAWSCKNHHQMGLALAQKEEKKKKAAIVAV